MVLLLLTSFVNDEFAPLFIIDLIKYVNIINKDSDGKDKYRYEKPQTNRDDI